MYRWYHRAKVCLAYLRDVSNGSELTDSEWFRRGWTLQELIAPRFVEFLDKNWQYLGNRQELSERIAAAANIDRTALTQRYKPEYFSVAQKMSWAARRSTSRLEDQAYCLLGLFGVNMPLLYGEGHNAFQRLQEQILAKSRDYSLFAWASSNPWGDVAFARDALMAVSPAAFVDRGRTFMTAFDNRNFIFESSNQGITILIHHASNPEILQKLLDFDEDNSERYGMSGRASCRYPDSNF